MAEFVAMVEARAGHRGNANRVEEKVGGLEVVLKAKFADVGHDVVGALRHPAAESRALECREQDRALALIHRFQLGIKRLGHRERRGAGLLERMRRADRKKVVDLANRRGQPLAGYRVGQPPAGYRVGLGEPADGYGALGHPGQAADRQMTRAVEHDVLVNLVGHCERVVALT